MNTEQTRVNNIHRCLDHVFGFCQEQGIDMKRMDRKELNELMYSFSNEAGIPDKHFQQAYSHQIAELNGTPSTILQSNQNNRIMKNKQPAPMLPMDLQILDKKKPDEPTTRTKRPRIQGTQRVEPYISPMMQMNSK